MHACVCFSTFLWCCVYVLVLGMWCSIHACIKYIITIQWPFLSCAIISTEVDQWKVNLLDSFNEGQYFMSHVNFTISSPSFVTSIVFVLLQFVFNVPCVHRMWFRRSRMFCGLVLMAGWSISIPQYVLLLSYLATQTIYPHFVYYLLEEVEMYWSVTCLKIFSNVCELKLDWFLYLKV